MRSDNPLSVCWPLTNQTAGRLGSDIVYLQEIIKSTVK